MPRRRNRARPRPIPHIELRARRWYATMEIPPALRAKLGKARFVKSLQTGSLRLAETLAAPLIAGWRREIATARGADAIPDLDDAAFWAAQDAMRARDKDPDRWRLALLAATNAAERGALLDRIGEIALDVGGEASSDGVTFDDAAEAAGAAFVADATAMPFVGMLDQWQAARQVTPQTRDIEAHDVRRFARAFPTVASVTRASVQRWTDGLIAGGLTPKTVRRILAALRVYWRYLQSVEIAGEAEPFKALSISSGGGHASQAELRQPFTAEQIVGLRDEAARRGDDTLAALIGLAMWTGGRIEELCSLKVQDVHLDAPIPYLSITSGKSRAALRDVPIHADLAPLLRRLAGDRRDGYVLASLTAGRYGNRSFAIVCRFGRLKASMDYGPQHVFHSIRKTVASMLKDAEVPESTAADLLGHRIASMSYGLYAGAVKLDTKAAAIAKLHYPTG